MTLKNPAGSGGALWFFQRISGLVLVLMLAKHFVVQHFLGTPTSGGLDFVTVSARFENPLYAAFNLMFLAMAAIHGLNGVWMVTEDYLHKPWQRMCVWSLLVLAGLGMVALAIVTTLSVT
jgi:succinate dehydrogenase / fumarate reductase, membrane anchor subunit